MRLDARSGLRGTVIDLDTGKPVPQVIWLILDSEQGRLEAYQLDSQGDRMRDINGDLLTYQAKGRFRFVPRGVRPSVQSLIMGAPSCVRCKNSITLPGKDLCAFCNAYDKGVKGFKVERIVSMWVNLPCQYPGCNRFAEYQVGDEVEGTPELGPITIRGRTGKAYFERGTTVGRRRWCAWHYQPPRLLDPKGEVVQEFEDSIRP